MNKNTTDISLSSYFTDIVIGYYEDEDLVRSFGREFGFDVDKDIFMALSFLYPSDMYVINEDREKLKKAAASMIRFSGINSEISSSQVMTADQGTAVILVSHTKKELYYALDDIKNTAMEQIEQLKMNVKIRFGIGTMESGIKGIKRSYNNALDAVRTGEIFKPDRVIQEYMGMEIYSAINQMVVSYGNRLTRTVLKQLGEKEKQVLSKYYKCKEDIALTADHLDITEEEVRNSLLQVKINTGLDVNDNEDNFKLHFIFIAKKILENDERLKNIR